MLIFSSARERGYTFLGLLFIISLLGMSVAGAALTSKVQNQREKERELIFVGQQYVDAVASYYHSAPGGAKKYPRNLEELLLDKRRANVKRHLRKPWIDPLTGSSDWNFILTKEGGIAGISSKAAGVPVKQRGFGELEYLLAGKSSYQDWRFIYVASRDKNDRDEADIVEDQTESFFDDADTEDDDFYLDNTEEGLTEDETAEELLEQSMQNQ